MIVNAYIRKEPCEFCGGPWLVILGDGHPYVDRCVAMIPPGEDMLSLLGQEELEAAQRWVDAVKRSGG